MSPPLEERKEGSGEGAANHLEIREIAGATTRAPFSFPHFLRLPFLSAISSAYSTVDYVHRRSPLRRDTS